MTPDESKAKSKASAKARAAEAAISQVAKPPLAVYHSPQINVPKSLHEFASLFHGEMVKVEQAQSWMLAESAWLGWGNPSNTDDYHYVNGTVIFRDHAKKEFPLQIESNDPEKALYIRYWRGPRYIGGVGANTPEEEGRGDRVGFWAAPLFNGVHAFGNGHIEVNAVRYWYGDGEFNPRLSPVTWGNTPHLSLHNYDIAPEGVGNANQWGNDCSTAPGDATIFVYGSALNTIGENGVLRTFSGLGGGYQVQQLTPYGGYIADTTYSRTRNGDTGFWSPWTASHSKDAGNTAGMNWDLVGYMNDPSSVRARGFMETRQYDDGNGLGHNSPGAGYGTYLCYGGGLFRTQIAINDTTGTIDVRTAYAGAPRPWHRHIPATMVKELIAEAKREAKNEIYAELAALGYAVPDQIPAPPQKEPPEAHPHSRAGNPL